MNCISRSTQGTRKTLNGKTLEIVLLLFSVFRVSRGVRVEQFSAVSP